jgi:hypothetical protein
MTRSGWLRESNRKLLCRGGHWEQYPVITVRPQLEPLEDRLSPTATSIGVALNITPNLLTFTATETITATVTQQGSTTPITSGTVSFNVNNQQGTAALNSNGQATFAVNLPLSAVAFNQTLDVSFQGPAADPSSFVAPVYLNIWNAVLPSQLTYGPPATNPTGVPPSLGSIGGESDALFLFGIPVVAHYVDPGLIDSVAINLFLFAV